ncbi:MAG TPA: FAD:protein FMN transferase [Pseudomonadales bacterium]
MGTQVTIKFQHDDKLEATQLMEQGLSIFRAVDRQMSPHKKDSELSRINQLAYKQALMVTDNLFALIGKAQQLSALTNGAFDITYASVGYLYDYRGGKKPAENALVVALPAVNYQSVALDYQQQTIHFKNPKTRIDLGGIGKGYAVDQVIGFLQQNGVSVAMVSAGGDSRIIGRRPDKPWLIGIKHPRRPGQHALLLPLEEGAISTSGDYERYFIDDNGQRHHHILNPKTGKSPQGEVASVSILGPDATTTDGLSTAVFVLGLDAGLALVNRLPGIEAILVDADGSLHYSNGMAPLTRDW